MNNDDEFIVLKAPPTRFPGVTHCNDDDDGLEMEFRSSESSTSNLVMPINCNHNKTWRDVARDKLVFRSTHSIILPDIFTWKKGEKTASQLNDDIVNDTCTHPKVLAQGQKSSLDSSSSDTVEDNRSSSLVLFQSVSGSPLGQSLILSNNFPPPSEEPLPRLDQKIAKPQPKYTSVCNNDEEELENASVLANSAQSPPHDHDVDELAEDDDFTCLLDVNLPFMSGNPSTATPAHYHNNPGLGSFPSSCTSVYSSAPSSFASSNSGISEVNHVPYSPDATDRVLLEDLTTLITEKLKKNKSRSRKKTHLLPPHNNNTSSKPKSKKIKTSPKKDPFEKVNDWLISSPQSPREPGVGIQRSESEIMVLGQDVGQSVFIGDGVAAAGEICNNTDASSSPGYESVHLSYDSVISSIFESASVAPARPSTAPAKYYHSVKGNQSASGGGGNSKQMSASPVQLPTCSRPTTALTSALTSNKDKTITPRMKKSKVTKKHDPLNPLVGQSDDNPNKVIDGLLTTVFRIQQIKYDKEHVYKFIDHMTLNKEDWGEHEQKQQLSPRPTTAPKPGQSQQRYYYNQQYRPNTSPPLHPSIKDALNKLPMEKKKKSIKIQQEQQQRSPKGFVPISTQPLQKPPWGFSALKKSITSATNTKKSATIKKRPLTPIVKPKQGVLTPYLKISLKTEAVSTKKKQVVDKSCQQPEKVSICTQSSLTAVVTSAHGEDETEATDPDKTIQVLFAKSPKQQQLEMMAMQDDDGSDYEDDSIFITQQPKSQQDEVKKSNLKSQTPAAVLKTKDSSNLNEEMNLEPNDLAPCNIEYIPTKVGLTKTESDSHAIYKFITKKKPLIEFDKMDQSHVPVAYTLLLPKNHEHEGGEKGCAVAANVDDEIDLGVIVRRENDAGQLPDVKTVIPCYLPDWMYLIIDEAAAKNLAGQGPPQMPLLDSSYVDAGTGGAGGCDEIVGPYDDVKRCYDFMKEGDNNSNSIGQDAVANEKMNSSYKKCIVADVHSKKLQKIQKKQQLTQNKLDSLHY